MERCAKQKQISFLSRRLPQLSALMVRVLYSHGLESGPGGYKVRTLLASGMEVKAPDLEMSLFNPFKRNSVVRSLLAPASLLGRSPKRWLSEAIDDSFESCVSIISSSASKTDCDVLVGSSWGGAVACAVVASGKWDGPAVLLCPALGKKEEWCGPSDHPTLSCEKVTAGLAGLPPNRKESLIIVHGGADQTVPMADSRALAEATGIRLEIVEGGSHGLGAWTGGGEFVDLVTRMASMTEKGPS